MHIEMYKMLVDRQETYWWHRGRRLMVAELLKDVDLHLNCKWLDIGCGPGGNVSLLDAFSPKLAVGFDISSVALSLAQKKAPNHIFIRGDLRCQLPFVDNSFNLVTSFNTLYHDWVDSEIDVLNEIKRVLAPGGIFVATEPAFSCLWREMDELAMGRRRYMIKDFVNLCDQAGLTVLKTTYFTSFGFLLILLSKALKRLGFFCLSEKSSIDTKKISYFVNEVAFAVSRLEATAITAGLSMPFGTTLLCISKKEK